MFGLRFSPWGLRPTAAIKPRKGNRPTMKTINQVTMTDPEAEFVLAAMRAHPFTNFTVADIRREIGRFHAGARPERDYYDQCRSLKSPPNALQRAGLQDYTIY